MAGCTIFVCFFPVFAIQYDLSVHYNIAIYIRGGRSNVVVIYSLVELTAILVLKKS